MADRLKSLSNAWRQLLLSVVLVFAPMSTLQACCCVKNAASETKEIRSCCAPRRSAQQSCCQKRAQASSGCDQVGKKCECRCSESLPFRPMAVRGTSEKSDSIRVVWQSSVYSAVEVEDHQELPHAGSQPDDDHVIAQNRTQSWLCVWRN